MPIVFICSGVLNLLLLFDKFNLKNKYKKTLYIIFLLLIQISYLKIEIGMEIIMHGENSYLIKQIKMGKFVLIGIIINFIIN